MEQLQRLTEKAIATNAEVASKLNLPTERTRSEVRPAATMTEPWQESPDPDQRATLSMRAPTQQVPRVPTTSFLRVEKNITAMDQAGKKKVKQQRKRRSALRLAPSKAVPAGNTWAQKKQAAIRVATNAVPTAKSTRGLTKEKTRRSRLMRPTVSSRSKTRTGRALAVELRPTKKKMTT